MKTTLPTEEIESAIRLVRDYPAAVWVFSMDHLSEIANYCIDRGSDFDDVSTKCAAEFHGRQEFWRHRRNQRPNPFLPADPAESICPGTPASASAAGTGRDPDPIAPRHLSGQRNAQAPALSLNL